MTKLGKDFKSKQWTEIRLLKVITEISFEKQVGDGFRE